uniref:Uncharacterized protein n=1 Tax=Wuchereria bancrofti TaxID=6293 RepID=A0AAF5RUW3_WUCBA
MYDKNTAQMQLAMRQIVPMTGNVRKQIWSSRAAGIPEITRIPSDCKRMQPHFCKIKKKNKDIIYLNIFYLKGGNEKDEVEI